MREPEKWSTIERRVWKAETYIGRETNLYMGEKLLPLGGDEKSIVPPPGTIYLHICRQELLCTLLPFIYNLLNCKINQT